MFIVLIKDLEVHLGNSNLSLGKSAIWFEPSVPKRETGKQIASAVYYQY